jgi:signal transduction histidine kinase
LQFRYQAEEFGLAVIDDGIGIEPSILARGPGKGHFGLSGMHERVKIASGELTPWSELGVGTRIELKIPAVHAYAVS